MKLAIKNTIVLLIIRFLYHLLKYNKEKRSDSKTRFCKVNPSKFIRCHLFGRIIPSISSLYLYYKGIYVWRIDTFLFGTYDINYIIIYKYASNSSSVIPSSSHAISFVSILLFTNRTIVFIYFPLSSSRPRFIPYSIPSTRPAARPSS